MDEKTKFFTIKDLDSWEKIFKINWEQLQLRKKNQLFTIFIKLVIFYTIDEEINFDFFIKTVNILPNEVYCYTPIKIEKLKNIFFLDQQNFSKYLEEPGNYIEKLNLWLWKIKKDLCLKENFAQYKDNLDLIYKFLAIFQVIILYFLYLKLLLNAGKKR